MAGDRDRSGCKTVNGWLNSEAYEWRPGKEQMLKGFINYNEFKVLLDVLWAEGELARRVRE